MGQWRMRLSWLMAFGLDHCHEWTKEVRYYMIVLLGVDKPNETFMTLVCPICKSSAQELPRTGDATGYHCATHGDFKVADTVAAEAKAKAKDYTREQWEVALEKAEQRAEQRAEPDEWPLIITDNFF
jgi:hypothetical protein